MIRRSVTALLLIASCTSVMGAMEVRDLRFGLGVSPLPDRQSGTFYPKDGSAPFGADIKYGDGTALTGVISATFGDLDPIGPLTGIELRYTSGTSSMDDIMGSSLEGRGAPSSSYTEAAAALHAGLGVALGDYDHIELLGIIGVSWASIESPANISTNVDAQKGQGNGIISGARIGWHHTWTSRWQIGLEAEWTRTDSDISTHYLDGTLESSVVNSGYGGRVVLGYRH